MSIINFGAGYHPPGVYLQQIISQLTNISTGVTPVIAIVGPTQGYFTYTDGFALSPSATITLSQQGINLSTITITSTQGQVYQPSDFTATNIAGTTIYNNTVTVELTQNSNITPGTVVYISYQYTNAEYFYPQAFSSPNAVYAAYGQPFNTSNQITSPISLAASLIFANGASQVYIAPTTDTGSATRAGLAAAYQNLSVYPEVNIIVPLPVGMTGTTNSPADIMNVGTDLGVYCNSQAIYNNLATGFLGYETSVTVSPATISSNITNFRIVNFYPNQLTIYNSVSNNTVVIGGYYLAAALAGLAVSQPYQEPITLKPIAGFSGIPTNMLITLTESYKDTLSSAGVAVAEFNPNNALVIRHGVTTLGSSVVTQEISLVRAADSMMQQIKSTLVLSGLIGSAETATSSTQVQSLIQAVLENCVSTGLIIAYTALQAVVQGTAPTVVLVTYAYSPSYPLNYIDVQFTVNASTGVIASTASSGVNASTSS
jgi:hypothetical protein